MIESSPDAFVAVDLQGTVAAFNHGAEALFRLPASAVLGHEINQSNLPETLCRHFARLLHSARAGEPVAEERHEITSPRHGHQNWVAEATFFSAGSGQDVIITACLHDITARRQTEEKTRRSNRILRTMAAGNHVLVRAKTEDELFQGMCRVIVETGGYRMAWAGQVEHDAEKSLRPLAHAGHEADYLALARISWGDTPHGHGPSGMSVRTGKPQFNNDITINPVMGPWAELALERGYLSSISLPLMDNAGVFGALTIYGSEPNAFGPEEVALLEELAGDVSYGAAALRTRRDHDEMEQTLRLTEERRQAQEALRQSEERYRLLVEHAVDGIFLSDAAGRYVDVNSAGHQMLGYTRDEILSRTIADIIAPEEVSRLVPAVAQLAEGEVARSEWRFRRKDGSEIIGEVVARQLPDGRLLGILRDITERRQAEQALRATQQRMQLATEATEVGIWEWNVKTGAILWDDQMFRLYGIPPTFDKFVNYETWATSVLPEDLRREEALMAKTIRDGGINHREFRLRRRDNGEIRVIRAAEATRADAQGNTAWVVGTNLDITDRKKAEDHIHFLLSEVNHRSLNLLTVVQSIAMLSAQHADPVTFASDLSERLASLAACQDLLVGGQWQGVDIADLVRAQLSPFRNLFGNRIVLAGPAARLNSSAAQAIGMSLHELATNAAKYGALSNNEGLVRIAWDIAAASEPPIFSLTWHEEDGPKVAPPTRKGFGQKVIVSMIKSAVNGTIELEYRETGVFWKLQAPVQTTVETD
jgi:PAS domain S-box-containing protein